MRLGPIQIRVKVGKNEYVFEKSAISFNSGGGGRDISRVDMTIVT